MHTKTSNDSEFLVFSKIVIRVDAIDSAQLVAGDRVVVNLLGEQVTLFGDDAVDFWEWFQERF